MDNFIKPSIYISISGVANKIFAMLFFILIARSINSEDYGLIRYLITLSFMYALPVTGITSALTKHIAQNIEFQRELRAYASNAFSLTLAIYTLLILVIYINNKHWVYLSAFVAAAIVDAFYNAYVTGLSNYSKMFGYKVLQNLIQLAILCIYIAVNDSLNIDYIVLVYLSSCLISAAILEFQNKEFRYSLSFSWKKIRELISFGFQAGIGSVGWTIMFGINTIWIERFRNLQSVAEYSVADTIVSIFAIFPSAISSIILPKIAKNSNIQAILRPLVIIVAFSFAISAGIFVTLMYLKDSIIAITFTSKYIQASDLVLPLSMSNIFMSLHVVFAAVYFGLGKPNIPSMTISVGCLVNVVLSYILVNKYGALGGSYSNMISSALSLTLICTHFYRYLLKPTFITRL